VVGYRELQLTLICRVNVVATVIALVDFMITASATFSVCNRLRNALYAKRIGLGTSLWGRGL